MQTATLVCVTAQRSSQKLILRGAEIARTQQDALLVLSVSGSGMNLLENPGVMDALNDLYAISGQVGAEMTMMQAANPRAAIASFIRKRNVKRIVLGQGKPDPNGLVAQLMAEFPHVAFYIEPTA